MRDLVVPGSARAQQVPGKHSSPSLESASVPWENSWGSGGGLEAALPAPPGEEGISAAPDLRPHVWIALSCQSIIKSWSSEHR